MPTKLQEFSNAKLKYVKLGYQYLVNHILAFLLIPTMATVLIQVLQLSPAEVLNLWNSLHFDFIHIICSFLIIISIATFYFMSRPSPVYLVDYACFKPPCHLRVPFAAFMEHARIVLNSQPKTVLFQMKILERGGLGEETCLPPAIHYIPPEPNMEAARDEAEMIIFSAMDSLLKKTGLTSRKL